jgi:hypothetical protein
MTDGVPKPVPEDRDLGRRSSFGRQMWWLILTIAFVVFVFVGRVRAFRGAEDRERVGVWDVWRDLRHDLPAVGAPGVASAGYLVTLVVFVVGSLIALWLALAADGSDEPRPPGRGSDEEPVPLAPPVASADLP